MSSVKKYLRTGFYTLIVVFALIGFVLVGGYFAVRYGFTNTAGIIDTQRTAFVGNTLSAINTAKSTSTDPSNSSIFNDDSWKHSKEWATFAAATLKDKEIIIRAGHKADVEPRLIFSVLAVEQLRLFFTSREVYKQVFAPLKILGVQSQFSWGIMGIKQETAQEVEKHLTDPQSPFYPGAIYEHLLDFNTQDTDSERFARLTDSHDRYYAYLYGALLLKELQTQWKHAGYDITNRPEILATLYNIGFKNSKPNPQPMTGGAAIQIGEKTYSFGALAAHIYYSNELIEEFPRTSHNK